MSAKMAQGEVERAGLVEMLSQRRWWKSQNGSVVRRRDMNIDHKLNSMAFLLRNARKIAEEYEAKPAFNNAPDGVWEELQEMVQEPERWMMRTPMFRALLQDVMSFADIGPEDLGLKSYAVATPFLPALEGRTVWAGGDHELTTIALRNGMRG